MTPLVAQPAPGKSLVEMFELQRRIVKRYTVLEGLPQYPLVLSSRTNQKLLKSFAYRVIEELGEAYDWLDKSLDSASKGRVEEAQDFNVNYNEELADAWHFMLEIFIFVGMDEYWMENWVNQYVSDTPAYGAILKPDNLLAGFLNLATFLNQQEGLIQRVKDPTQFIICPEQDVAKMPWLSGGKKMSPQSLQVHERLFWNITHRITIAMNGLKARDWQSTDQSSVNVIEFTSRMMEAFIALQQLMVYTYKTELSIFNSYLIKNQICWERLNEGQ